ncbi:hypothetical protein BpHYR1_022093 [Brachionus plicatilis]|uniref:Uncharacterized protein n=1 Tax=Brachionus plicatilis TaxID=10195 RepID=A0A3M7SVI1_BRAPC|nr:hypothetical protein BpHYR1_022093 [Brachionus plicatilis]
MFWYRYFNKKSSKLEADAAGLGPRKNPGLRNRGSGQRGLGTSPGLKFRVSRSCGENLKTGAEAMAMQHIHKLGEAIFGDTVQISDVDRGPADPVNILAYITKINNHKLYQLATKHAKARVVESLNASPGFTILNTEEEIYAKIARKF